MTRTSTSIRTAVALSDSNPSVTRTEAGRDQMHLQILKPRWLWKLALAGLCLLLLGSNSPLHAAQEGAEMLPRVGSSQPGLSQPVSYRIQPGDEISISVLPVMGLDSQAIVSPDGQVYLKNIGPVIVGGSTIQEVEARVRKQLLKRLRNPRVTVTLVKLVQPIAAPSITVMGEVNKPGRVDLIDGLRLRKAIELAGGVTKESDLSRVIVVRKDLSRKILDLSKPDDALDPSRNSILEAEDSILVPAISKVTVIGAVGKPGPVDLEEGLRARKALDLAGGANRDADLSQVFVVHRDLRRAVIDLSSQERVTDPKHNLLLQPGDSLEVLPLPRVTVTGAVVKPGLVDPEDGLRVRKAIELAGGALSDADLSRVVVARKDLTREVVNVAGDSGSLDPKRNVLLRPGDAVEVPLPYEVGSVTIRGEGIQNPGSYELKPGWGVDDLITAAGKLTLVANTEKIELIRNGSRVETINLLERMKQGEKGKVPLQPGDDVFIPRHENVVVLVGPVPYPGPRALRKGQRISEFLREGDMQTTLALDPSKVDFGKVELYRKGSAPRKISLKRALGNPDSKDNVLLESEDMLFLPPRDNRQRMGLIDILRTVPYFGAFANLF